MREKDKMRNEEARAAGRLTPYVKLWEVTFTSDVALPVTSVPQRFRLFMPTGRFNWAISPVREIRSDGRERESDERRMYGGRRENEE